MSESLWTRIRFIRYTCDKRSCDAELDIAPSCVEVADNRFSARDESAVEAALEGWSHWRNDRQSYTYCPSHSPSAASALRLVW